jgi:hypothetical protein
MARSVAMARSIAMVRLIAMAQSVAGRPSTAMWAALLVGALLAACDGAGCRGRSSKRDAGSEPPPMIVDGAAGADGPAGDGAAGDAAPSADDAGSGAGDAGSNAPSDAAVILDAGTAASLCPPWRAPVAAGRRWLYLRAVSNGVALTPAGNHVDIYVRPTGAPLPGERADADDPCAVASYDQTAPRVRVLAAAIGFSSQEREFSPLSCTDGQPCSVELPRSLEAKFYVASAKGVSVRAANDVPEADRVSFAASVAGDALARSKALKRPLADELDRAEKATNVPALDLAIHYTESKLRKKCDASCLDAPEPRGQVLCGVGEGGQRARGE